MNKFVHNLVTNFQTRLLVMAKAGIESGRGASRWASELCQDVLATQLQPHSSVLSS